ncbi:glycosyltransferase family 2 protein [Ureibacillus aquaedulcis]|uniref:Glycosyltransferase n=1 Tax=Ureibacillus aquaedulcis TaxID=3058421 RepID=A0ABT8GUK7_9BACL|nr:glycosyltransferase [Ureibacillus sp. BA0131]MDN4495103.1 glycosyltransferase [Ureibacillus sp. BA0131]
MKNKPFVSVIIPTYNRANQVLEAIQSVLNQTYQDFEILVIDDNSSDNTSQIINDLKDPRIYYYKLSKNQGAPTARNIGIKKSKGDLIAFLDSDDQWVFNKLEKQIEIINNDNNIGLVYTGIKVINNQYEKVIKPCKRGDLSESLLKENYVGSTSSILVKKDLMIEAGGFDLTFKSCQDWDLFIKLSQKTEIDFVEQPLVLYFEHDGERISTNPKSVLDGYYKIQKKYSKLIGNLPKKDKQHHYLNIGKRILITGINTQDIQLLKQGRSQIYKSVKVFPLNSKSILFFLYSLSNKKILLSTYRVMKKIKTSKNKWSLLRLLKEY